MENIDLEQEKRNRRERGLRQAGILPSACDVAHDLAIGQYFFIRRDP